MNVPLNQRLFTRRDFVGGGAALLGATAVSRICAAESSEKGRAFTFAVLNPDCMAGGAGQCVVMLTPGGKCYLWDTANGCPHTNKVKNNGKDIVVPWLKAHGVEAIDGLIISHYHADHFGGFLWMYDHFPIRKVFDNSFIPTDGKPLREHDAVELARAKDALAAWEKAHPGMLVTNTNSSTDLGWDEPGVKFEVVWPPKEGPVGPLAHFRRSSATDFPFHHLLNANSTGLRVTVGKRTFFIAGDIQEQYITDYMRPYLEKRNQWNCDVLRQRAVDDCVGEGVAAHVLAGGDRDIHDQHPRRHRRDDRRRWAFRAHRSFQTLRLRSKMKNVVLVSPVAVAISCDPPGGRARRWTAFGLVGGEWIW